MDELHDHCAFPDTRRHPLDRPVAHVPHRLALLPKEEAFERHSMTNPGPFDGFEDSRALAQALEWALENRAKPAQGQTALSWREIGGLTKAQYRLASSGSRAAKAHTVAEPAP